MLNSTGRIKLLKPLCSIFLCFILLVVFSVSSFAENENMASRMWFSKFKYNSVWGMTSDQAPFPDGCFIEVQKASSFFILNFDRFYSYKFAQPDVNGAVGSTHSPFIWYTDDNRLQILSTSPIYMYSSSSSTSHWSVYGQPGTSVPEETIIYVDGDLQEEFSNNYYQMASCSVGLSDVVTLVANQPSCARRLDSLGNYYPSYQTSVACPCLYSACLSSSFVSANGSSDQLADLETLLHYVLQLCDDSSVMLGRVGNIRTLCESMSSTLSSLLSKLTHLDTISNSFLPYIEDIYSCLDDFYNDFNTYASDDLYFQEYFPHEEPISQRHHYRLSPNGFSLSFVLTDL